IEWFKFIVLLSSRDQPVRGPEELGWRTFAIGHDIRRHVRLPRSRGIGRPSDRKLKLAAAQPSSPRLGLADPRTARCSRDYEADLSKVVHHQLCSGYIGRQPLQTGTSPAHYFCWTTVRLKERHAFTPESRAVFINRQAQLGPRVQEKRCRRCCLGEIGCLPSV